MAKVVAVVDGFIGGLITAGLLWNIVIGIYAEAPIILSIVVTSTIISVIQILMAFLLFRGAKNENLKILIAYLWISGITAIFSFIIWSIIKIIIVYKFYSKVKRQRKATTLPSFQTQTANPGTEFQEFKPV